jgi:energy-coupling factor transport system ATP-binding protein
VALIVAKADFAYNAGRGFASPALSGIDMVVERGGLTLVLGPTGSGNSTLLRLASGLLDATSGTVEIDGETMSTSMRKRLRGRVGLVFQNPESQFFAPTVLEDVAFGPRNLGRTAPEDDAREAMCQVGLDPDEFGGRTPFELSGGEARRAAVAGVLAMRPDYLLLDEPTAGLDARGRASVRAAVAAARDGAGLVIVTHEAGDFLGSADRVLVLSDGGMAFVGSPDEILEGGASLPAGVRLPDVPRTMLLAAAVSGTAASPTLDPLAAADALAAMAGGAL